MIENWLGLDLQTAQVVAARGADAAKATSYLKSMSSYGSPAAMPNWRTSGNVTNAGLTAASGDLAPARPISHDP